MSDYSRKLTKIKALFGITKETKQRVVHISVNGVLRDLWNKLLVEYQKYYLETPPEAEEAFTYRINNEIATCEYREKMEFQSDEEMEYFLYVDFAMEIFGHTYPAYKNVMLDLQRLINENPEHRFRIVSQEVGKSIPSTLFFLSKTSCPAKEYQFFSSEKDIDMLWSQCDEWITDDPKIINRKPAGKKVVKLTKDFNTTVAADVEIAALSDLLKNTND